MHKHVIHRIDQAKFSLRWFGKGDPLQMDFNPVINKYRLTNEFVLLHWQAKPKFLRTWGIYDSKTDSYSCVSTNLVFPSCAVRLVDVNEAFVNTVPTAMILFNSCRYMHGENRIKYNEPNSNSNNNTNGNNSVSNGTVESIPEGKPSTKKG